MTTVFKIILLTVFAACLPMMTLSCTKTSKSKVASATQRKKQKLPSHITETLNAAKSFELISLNPDRSVPNPKRSFHGWPALGSTMITLSETKEKIINGLQKAAAEADWESQIFCFNPRHGIRAVVNSKTLELVICFECLQLQAYFDGRKQEVPITEELEGYLNRTLRAAAVTMPPPRAR